MMKNDKLVKIFMFNLYELTAVEEYLEEMAMQGWMIEKIKSPFFTFHKIEPKKLTFAVDIFMKIPTYDTVREETIAEHFVYCRAPGWMPVLDNDKIQVFCSENEDKPSINTDPKTKLKAIIKGMIPSLLSNFLYLILGTFYLSSFTNNMFLYVVTSYDFLGLLTLWFNMTIFSLVNLLGYGVWIIKSIKKIRLKEIPQYNSKINKRNSNLIRVLWILSQSIIFAIGLTCSIIHDFTYSKLEFTIRLLAPIVITLIINYIYFKRRENSKLRNFGFLIEISKLSYIFFILAFSMNSIIFVNLGIKNIASSVTNDVLSSTVTDIPLTLEDLNLESTDNSNHTIRISETFLAQNTDYNDSSYDENNNVNNGISYSVFTSPIHCVLDTYLKNATNPFPELSYTEVEGTVWDANSVYIYKSNNNRVNTIVEYDDKIFEFRSDISLNDDQIKIIRDKLDLYN